MVGVVPILVYHNWLKGRNRPNHHHHRTPPTPARLKSGGGESGLAEVDLVPAPFNVHGLEG